MPKPAHVAALFAMLVTGGASANCSVGRIAQLPVTMSGLQPYVTVQINGVERRLLADSGAFFSSITPGTARELKLPTKPMPYWFSVRGIGGAADVSFTTVKDFTISGTPLRNLDFLVGGSEVGDNLGGILGRNILGIADAEYDLANGAIRLMRASGCGDRAMAYWAGAKPFNIMKIEPSSERTPPAIVNVTINGVKLKATLDSGSSTSVLFLSAAKRANVVVSDAEGEEKGVSRGFGRRLVPGYSAPLADIKIGDEEIKHTRIRVLETTLTDTDMLLGADFFLSHRIYVSNLQRKVYFTYNGGPVFSLVPTRIDLPTSPGPGAGAKPSPVAAGEAEPADAPGFSRRGQAFAARRDFARALPDLDRAVTLAPENADYVYQRGMARLASGQMFLAMADIEQALKLRPADTAALFARAQLRFAGHDTSGATHDLDEIAKVAPAAGDIRLGLAVFYERAERMSEAADQYTLWIAAHPDDSRRPVALNGRCRTRALLDRDLEKALADCNGALRAQPKNYAFLDSRGLALFRSGAFDRSIADYDASLAYSPKSASSLYGRGLAKIAKGDSKGGRADLAAALVIDPKVADNAAKWGLKP